MDKRFPKHSKLCGQMRIAQLYHEGKRFVVWPLRVTYQAVEDDTQVLIWAPKSLFKHAVDRNHMRRLMREAYRLLVKSGAMPERTEWVFIGRSALKDRKCQDVMEEMARLASRAS